MIEGSGDASMSSGITTGRRTPTGDMLDTLPDMPPERLRERLGAAGLRPTRQRLALARRLFAADRHVTAEGLHEECAQAGEAVSLATVYNALNQFTRAGLLREVSVEGARTYFDTNTGDHHHFFIEDEDRILDIPPGHVSVRDLPPAPEGMEIDRVDVVVRLRRAQP